MFWIYWTGNPFTVKLLGLTSFFEAHSETKPADKHAWEITSVVAFSETIIGWIPNPKLKAQMLSYYKNKDKNRPIIAPKSKGSFKIIQTNDTRFRGIYENISNSDTIQLICNSGGVRDVLFEKSFH